MATSRLARLQVLLQKDLEQLPDLPKPELPPKLPPEPLPKLEQLPVSPLTATASTPPPTTSPATISTKQGAPLDEFNANQASVCSDTRFLWVTDPNRKPAPPLAKRSARLLLNLQHGELGSFDESYCPILELSRYCYKYVHGDDRQRVATKLFDAGKFWARGWDIFSLRNPDTHAPLVFVTESQLQDLLYDINSAFGHLDLKIDGWQREYGLVTRFPPHPDTTPRYLGRCSSKDECTALMENAPCYGYRLPSDDKRPQPDDKTLEAFKAQMTAVEQLRKAKNSASRNTRMAQLTLTNKAMAQQLKRTQRYLGLRPKNEEGASSELLVKCISKALPRIDVSFPAPYPFESAPVIISIDVESHERSSRMITEVGICTLDTRDLHNVPPGVNGENWRHLSQDRHIRVKEYVSHRNHEFVDGCPGNFEFGEPKGESEFVSLRDMPALLEAAFKPPYSKKLDVTSSTAFPDLSASCPSSNTQDPSMTRRNILILGHDPNQDISYFQTLGFNPLNLPVASSTSPGIIEILDTAILDRTYARLQQPRRLGMILAELDINAWFLHNAGNDAVYTMWAMLAIAVKDAAERGDEAKKAAREAQVEARTRMELREQEEFKRAAVATYDGEDEDDGGVSVSPMQSEGVENILSTSAGRLGLGGRGPRGNGTVRGRGRGRARSSGRVYPAAGVHGGEGYHDRDAPQ